MPHPLSLTARLLLVSALAPATSCTPAASLTPPAELFHRPPKPVMPIAAVTSEDAYEDWREDVDDWGDDLDARIWAACRWFGDADIAVACGPTPALISRDPHREEAQ